LDFFLSKAIPAWKMGREKVYQKCYTFSGVILMLSGK